MASKACLRKAAPTWGPIMSARENMEAGKIGALLQLVDYRRIGHTVQLVDAAENTAEVAGRGD